MSTRARGRVIDENGSPWPGLTVSIRDTATLFLSELARATTLEDGRFELSYASDALAPQFGNRPLELVVHDRVRRVLLRASLDDIDGEVLAIGDRVIRRADAEGFLVTLGTGASRFVSQGNAITILVDREAFEHAAARFQQAASSIMVSQLFFAVPEGFFTDATKETPSLVFRFDPPEPTVAQPRKIDPDDVRPERLFIDLAGRGVDVRILVHDFRLPLFLRILIGALTFPLAGSDGVFAVNQAIRDKLTDLDELQGYFGPAGQPRIVPRAFPQPIVSSGVMHAKLVIVDGTHAVSFGSPFGQSYVDSSTHAIDAPPRGRSSGLPKHDAGFGVSGPAVADLHETVRLLWNEDVPDAEDVGSVPRPPAETQGGDAIAAMQIVRTLSAGRFDGLDEGEKGILEAYQRAIAGARDFIYLETQYFTNDAIGDALTEALRARPSLQAIVLLNIAPDVPAYPFKQRRLITRIREALGETPGGRPRFGVFTRWTHETGSPRPRILPIYVHAKVGLVDDRWATIGSANLDGLSLDSSLVGDVLTRLFGIHETRAVEVNGLILNGVDGQPPTDAVDLLRRRLWAEHLGYDAAPGTPDVTRPELQAPPGPDGWLGLWRDRAREKLTQLVDRPARSQAGLGHVLPWPDEDDTFDTPRVHLNALGVRTHAVVPLKSTRPFLFKEGDWKPGAAPEMDYP